MVVVPTSLRDPDVGFSSSGLALAGTPTITKLTIEQVAIGSRVSGDSPRPWEYDGELPDPEQSTWQLATFSLPKEDGSWIDVEMIRPAEYWEAQGAVPGSYVLMQFPELEASGLAKLKSLAACPPIAEGAGLVVTARIVTRQVAELVEIAFGDGQLLTGTPPHPIWSIELCTAAGLLIGQSTSWTNFRIASSRAILSSTICCSRQQSYQRVSALTLATVR